MLTLILYARFKAYALFFCNFVILSKFEAWTLYPLTQGAQSRTTHLHFYQLASLKLYKLLLVASTRMWIILIICVCCVPSPTNGDFSEKILPIKHTFYYSSIIVAPSLTPLKESSKQTVYLKMAHFVARNGPTWQACQCPKVVQKGPKWLI